MPGFDQPSFWQQPESKDDPAGHQELLSQSKEENSLKASLESVRSWNPDAVRVLENDFGIRHFNRYPLGVLQDMYLRRNESGSYITIAVAVEDHNGAMASQQRHYFETWQAAGAECRLRIVECESENELGQRLHQLNQKYGQTDSLVLDAHGTNASITLGSGAGGMTTLTSVQSTLREFVKIDGEVTLIACSTGSTSDDAPNLAEAVSHGTGLRVNAPNGVVSCRGFGPYWRGNKLSFAPVYGGGDERSFSKTSLRSRAKQLLDEPVVKTSQAVNKPEFNEQPTETTVVKA